MKRHIAMALTCLGLSACRPSSEAGPTPPPSSEVDGSPGGPIDGGAGDTTPPLTGDDCYFGWDGGACPPGCGEQMASIQGDSGTCAVSVRLYCGRPVDGTSTAEIACYVREADGRIFMFGYVAALDIGKGAGLPALRRCTPSELESALGWLDPLCP
ncbi:MAG: hypothetical protein IPG50_05145 [Myxococcales bacterium]|nr:hypothetical protein [Myxococcales bacterium]